MPNGLVQGLKPTLQIGGRIFTDLSNLIVLTATVKTASRYTTLRKVGASAGYQVPVGKTFTAHAMRILGTGSAQMTTGILLYGDTDVGYDSASAPTNPIFPGGFSEVSAVRAMISIVNTTYYNSAEVSNFFKIIAQKYPCIFSDNVNANYLVYGYET